MRRKSDEILETGMTFCGVHVIIARSWRRLFEEHRWTTEDDGM